MKPSKSFLLQSIKVQGVGLLLMIMIVALPLVLAQAQTIRAQKQRITVDTVAGGLVHPWGLAFLPDGTMLVTERRGTLQWIGSDGQKTLVDNVPAVATGGQGGLLDIALDPNFTLNKYVYMTYSEPRRNGTTGTSVAKAHFIAGTPPRLDKLRVLFRQNNPTNSKIHFGSRLVLTSNNTLFFTIGDRGQSERAQDPFDHAGSTLRINTDGSIPTTNPFAAGVKGAPEIWSLGHRNPQGAVLNRQDGTLWTVEHGAAGGDEINTPSPGRNYGWPVISYATHYSGAKIGVGTRHPGMGQPKWFWDPSIAPSGLAYYDGDQFPNWQGNLFVGALRGAMLVRLTLKSGKIVSEERLLKDRVGRIRDVRQGPDGTLYLLTDNAQGSLLRLRHSEP